MIVWKQENYIFKNKKGKRMGRPPAKAKGIHDPMNID